MDHPTFQTGTVDAVVEYMLANLSAKRVLESLYSGIACTSVEPGRGIASFAVGQHRVDMPLGLLNKANVTLDRPISKAETLEIGKAICCRANYVVCLDFLWCRRQLPIYGQLFQGAKDGMRGPMHCWVLSHALSILHWPAHTVIRATFLTLLDGTTQLKLERTLETLLGKPWPLSEHQADRLFEFTQPFSLFPQVVESGPPGQKCHLWISDTVAVAYSFRELCFLAILCTAHANLIWPDGPPPVFSSACETKIPV